MKEKKEILVISSDKSELDKVLLFVKRICNKWNIDFIYFNRIFLCLSEAVINSIEHGNRGDINKKVTIYVTYNDEQLLLEVSDEGNGFDVSNIEDPTSVDNIRKESGRGIYIIKSLTEYCRFGNQGKSVHFNIRCR